jgi:hypothetical protein
MSDWGITVVHFRRERNALEMSEDPSLTGRWHPLGSLVLPSLPTVGMTIYINSEEFVVQDIAWSICIVPEGQPSFDDPQVLITVRHGNSGEPDFDQS